MPARLPEAALQATATDRIADGQLVESFTAAINARYGWAGTYQPTLPHRHGGPPYARLPSDVEILKRLNEVANCCVRAGDSVAQILELILDTAIFVTAANKGTAQVYAPEKGTLVIAAQRGFGTRFLEFFSQVHGESAAVCGAALSRLQRVMVEDVTASALFTRNDALEVLLSESVRAVQSTPLISSAGNVLGMISTHYTRPTQLSARDLRFMDSLARQAADYLERKAGEKVLRVKEAELENITANVPVLITRCSRELRYVFVNKACAEFLGKPVGQILGKPIVEVMGAEAFASIRPHFERALAGEKVEFETEIPYAAAGPRYMHVGYAPEFDAQGVVVGWIGTITDISERRRAEQKLREADRHKDEFLAMLAHELRNPLAPIATGVEILEQTADRQTVQATLASMKRQVRHMARLVDDLMDVSRVSLGKIELRKERVDLRVIAELTVQSSRSMVASMGHDLQLKLPAQAVHVSGDTVRLVQVLCNLVSNGCKFMDRGGLIELLIEGTETEGVVRVRDHGIGMSAQDIPRIFDLFVQLGDSRQGAAGGLGLGLTVVRGVVEKHEGTVTARSDGPGRGSEFIVRLPICTGQADHNAPPAPPLSSAQRRVLIVDDNRDAAESLAKLLQMNGHATCVAHDGVQAVERAGEFRPELVLLDIGLPRLNGYDACRSIRREPWAKDMVFVAVSGYGQTIDLREARAAGFRHYLLKPLSAHSLLQVLANATPQDDQLAVQ